MKIYLDSANGSTGALGKQILNQNLGVQAQQQNFHAMGNVQLQQQQAMLRQQQQQDYWYTFLDQFATLLQTTAIPEQSNLPLVDTTISSFDQLAYYFYHFPP